MPSCHLVVLVPVLARPQRVAPTIAGFSAPGVRVCFIPDPDDGPELDALSAANAEILTMMDGGYAAKINRAITLTDEPLIFLAADDLEPQPGWFEAAHAHIEAGAQVVGINDLIRRTRALATHFLITRAYAERPILTGEPGPLCEDYDHSCVDDELAATARYRGVYAYAEDSHVRHLHPDIRTAPMDDTYRKGRAKIAEDRKLFKTRRYWFIEQGQGA